MANIDNTKDLKYNYYDNLAVHLNTNNGYHYTFKGKENTPNVILVNNDKISTFNSKSMHILPKTENSGELLIEHVPITNYEKNMRIRFPLETDEKAKPNDIDKIIKTLNSNITLNNVLPQDTNCIYKETNNIIDVKFVEPIKVRSSFNSMNVVESFDVIQKIGENGVKMEDEEGNPILEASGSSWMECDNVPVDSEDIPMYNIRARTQFDKSKENFMIAYYFVFLLLWMTFLYFIIGPIYKMGLFAFAFSPGSNPEETIQTVVTIEKVLTAVLFILGIGLILGSLNKNNSDKDNTNLSTSGMFFLVTLIGIGIVSVYKKSNEVLTIIPDEALNEWGPDDDQLYSSYFKWY